MKKKMKKKLKKKMLKRRKRNNMIMKKEKRHLRGFAKKIVSKDTRRKIFRIKDHDDHVDVLKYCIKNTLFNHIEEFEKELENQDVHFFSIVKLLKSKSDYFLVTFHKKDFKVVMKLLNDAKKHLKKG